jgi:hypothetical protein
VASSSQDLILINLILKSEARKIFKILFRPMLSGFRKSISGLKVPKLGLLLLLTRDL